jgi:hypothetical protein
LVIFPIANNAQKGEIDIAQGLPAASDEIVEKFGVQRMVDGYHPNMMSAVIGFQALTRFCSGICFASRTRFVSTQSRNVRVFAR